MPKIKLVKNKTNEMSGTGGSASATPGTGAQYASPIAFPKVASDYNKTFGTHFAPSIPNRPSKAITYKEIWEDKFQIGTDTKTDSGVYFEPETGAFYYNVIDGLGNRWNKLKVNTIDDVLAQFPNWKWTEIGKDAFGDNLDENTDVVVATLNNPQLDPDVKKLLFKGYKDGHLTADKVVSIVNSLLRENTDEADYDSDTTGGEGLQTQNPLPVKEGTWKLGSPDDIRNFIKIVNQIKDKFYNVVGDDEVFDGLDRAASRAEELIQLKNMDNPLIREARYSEFKKMTQVRTPGEQLHRAIREIRRKIDEINKLVSYTEKMKTEMKSDVSEVNYLKRTKEALAKISARIQETSNKIKRLVQ